MGNDRFEIFSSVEKEGMLLGVTAIPECWKNPMDVSVFMEMERKNEE